MIIKWKKPSEGCQYGIAKTYVPIEHHVFRRTNTGIGSSRPCLVGTDWALERWKEFVLGKKGTRKDKEEWLQCYVECYLLKMTGAKTDPMEVNK